MKDEAKIKSKYKRKFLLKFLLQQKLDQTNRTISTSTLELINRPLICINSILLLTLPSCI